MQTSARKRFNPFEFFQVLHNESAYFTDKEVGGTRDFKLLYVEREVAALSCFETPENTRKEKPAHVVNNGCCFSMDAALVAARWHFPI